MARTSGAGDVCFIASFETNNYDEFVGFYVRLI